jgi:two-component system, NarL family, nitrate/nitrite response regulator NarL
MVSYSTGPSPIRLLIVDDHTLFREGLVRLLAQEPDFRVLGHCASVREALHLVSRLPIDLVILDYDLGLQRGTEFVETARTRGFTGRILIVTAGLGNEEAAELVRQGADAIFLKHNPPAELSLSIRRVASGGTWIEPRYREALEAPEAVPAPTAPAPDLTERETAILRGVFEGLSNKEIADRMCVSESSVKGILQQLFKKTRVRTRSQLVRVALDRYKDVL